MTRHLCVATALFALPVPGALRAQVWVEDLASVHAAATAAWQELSPSPDTGTFYYRVAQAGEWRRASHPWQIFDSTAIRRLGLDPDVTMVELLDPLSAAKRSVIEDSVLARTGIRLVHLADEDYRRLIEQSPGGEFWTRFRERFPDAVGLLSYSTTRLNAHAGLAGLAVDFGCGGRCGDGRAILLRRASSGWESVMPGQVYWVR